MTEVLVHQISYEKPRTIKVLTTRNDDDVPTPDSESVFSHEELLGRHRELVGARTDFRESSLLGRLMVRDEDCDPSPSIPQLVRQHGIPSGSVIVQQVLAEIR